MSTFNVLKKKKKKPTKKPFSGDPHTRPFFCDRSQRKKYLPFFFVGDFFFPPFLSLGKSVLFLVVVRLFLRGVPISELFLGDVSPARPRVRLHSLQRRLMWRRYITITTTDGSGYCASALPVCQSKIPPSSRVQ